MKVRRLLLTNTTPLIKKQLYFNEAIMELYHGSTGKWSRILWDPRSTL